VRDTRLRLWSEHLQRPVSEIDGEPVDVGACFSVVPALLALGPCVFGS
jgi:hypothetical protein